MMNSHSQNLFNQATEQLRLAQSAFEAGQYGESEKLALQASETIAASYMVQLDNALVTPSDETFERFASHIWNARTTSEAMKEAWGIVGDVKALREAHDWSIPDDISKADAVLMLQSVGEMLESIKDTSQILSSTSLIPMAWPARNWLRLIFFLCMQIRSQLVT